MQNAVGSFHQDILGSIFGCENLGSGGGLDVCNRTIKLVAEIKNKFNTQKGSDKIVIYDTIKKKLQNEEFDGFTGYYVEIIPAHKNLYDEPFMPSDKETKKTRPKNSKIRVIDGVSFYALMSGRKHALRELFDILPEIIAEHFKYKCTKENIEKYIELFGKAFGD